VAKVALVFEEPAKNVGTIMSPWDSHCPYGRTPGADDLCPRLQSSGEAFLHLAMNASGF